MFDLEKKPAHTEHVAFKICKQDKQQAMKLATKYNMTLSDLLRKIVDLALTENMLNEREATFRSEKEAS